MGFGELMASVLSGIASIPELFESAAIAAAFDAGAAPVCGDAAFAQCSFTSTEIMTTDTTGKNRIIHRIFMKTPVFAVGRNHTAGSQAASPRHGIELRRTIPDKASFWEPPEFRVSRISLSAILPGVRDALRRSVRRSGRSS